MVNKKQGLRPSWLDGGAEAVEMAKADGWNLDADRAATQRHTVFGVVVAHTGQRLTPERVELIVANLVREMQDGPTAWAFSKESGGAS